MFTSVRRFAEPMTQLRRLNSLRLYANIMFHPCQLKVTVEGQQFEHLISCLHYVSFKFAKLKLFHQ